MRFSLQKISSHQIDASQGFLYCSIIKITIRVIFFDNFWQFLWDGDSWYDADNQTLTFQTNQFSDYAIAYKDVKKSGQTGRNDSNGTKKDTTTGNISTSIYSPQTGDTTDLSGYVCDYADRFGNSNHRMVNLKKEENGIKKMTSTPVDLPQEFSESIEIYGRH